MSRKHDRPFNPIRARVRVRLPGRLTAIFEEFAGTQAASGIVLLACALIAFAWANSPWSTAYHHVWEIHVGGSLFGLDLEKSLLHWINDGLMAVFFFLIGLEIKRELVRGELSSVRSASLPVVAALGGMLVPALIYLFFTAGKDGSSGWGIPMATDIAFSLGILALAGDRVPSSLKVFLAAFAIADDLGAVLVIALFYSSGVSVMALLVGALAFLAMLAVGRAGVQRSWIYLLLGAALWLAILASGIHATIAGVLAAMAIPLRHSPGDEGGPSLLERLEHSLQPWVAYGVMPVFALANAGVTLEGDGLRGLFHPVTLGAGLGLVVGKFAGLSLFVWLAVRTGFASLPRDAQWKHMLGVAMLGGVGFTMSLFIAGLAFPSEALLVQAKVGVLAGSLVAGIAGWLMCRMPSRMVPVDVAQ